MFVCVVSYQFLAEPSRMRFHRFSSSSSFFFFHLTLRNQHTNPNLMSPNSWPAHSTQLLTTHSALSSHIHLLNLLQAVWFLPCLRIQNKSVNTVFSKSGCHNPLEHSINTPGLTWLFPVYNNKKKALHLLENKSETRYLRALRLAAESTVVPLLLSCLPILL